MSDISRALNTMNNNLNAMIERGRLSIVIHPECYHG